MIQIVLRMYITLMPVILAGIMNMVFTKTSVYKKYRRPIDKGKVLKDGKRLFGDNKTWIGFFSMIIFAAISQVIWGLVCNLDSFSGLNYIYDNIENTVVINMLIGIVFGLAYVICELPNSFVKRRIGITPGKTASGIKGIVFYIVDQIDSIIGVTFCLLLFCKMPVWQFFLYIFLGAITHIIVNLILYALKIRKNI